MAEACIATLCQHGILSSGARHHSTSDARLLLGIVELQNRNPCHTRAPRIVSPLVVCHITHATCLFRQCAQVLAQLRGIVAEVTGSSTIGDEEPLMAAGLDSLAAVELRARVEAAFGVALPATVALDYPTLKVSTASCCVQKARPYQHGSRP